MQSYHNLCQLIHEQIKPEMVRLSPDHDKERLNDFMGNNDIHQIVKEMRKYLFSHKLDCDNINNARTSSQSITHEESQKTCTWDKKKIIDYAPRFINDIEVLMIYGDYDTMDWLSRRIANTIGITNYIINHDKHIKSGSYADNVWPVLIALSVRYQVIWAKRKLIDFLRMEANLYLNNKSRSDANEELQGFHNVAKANNFLSWVFTISGYKSALKSSRLHYTVRAALKSLEFLIDPGSHRPNNCLIMTQQIRNENRCDIFAHALDMSGQLSRSPKQAPKLYKELKHELIQSEN